MVFFTESGIKTEAEAEFEDEFKKELEQTLSEPETDDDSELDAEPDAELEFESEELFEDEELIEEDKKWTKIELLDKLIELTDKNSDLYIALTDIKDKYNLDENQEIKEDDMDTVEEAEEDVLPESIIANSIETLKRMY